MDHGSPAPTGTAPHSTASHPTAPSPPAALHQGEQHQDEQHLDIPSGLSQDDRPEAEVRIYDLDQLLPGEQVQLWRHGQFHGVGTVEEAAPALGVVWIRESLGGYRRMVHTQDTDLRSPVPHHGAGYR